MNAQLLERENKKERDWSIAAFPLVFYQPETSFQFGVGGLYSFAHKNKEGIKSSDSFVSPFFLYSIKKQMRAELFGQFYFDDDNWWLNYEFSYWDFFLPYFGIGEESLAEDEESYSFTRPRFFLDLQRTVFQNKAKNRRLSVGLRYDVEKMNIQSIEENGTLDNESAFGKKGSFTQGIGFQSIFDSRDDVYFPWKGAYLKVNAMTFPSFLGSDFQHHEILLDYRNFISIKDRVVIASQVHVTMTFGDVPFHRLAMHGGKNLGRGYADGRFRDNYAVTSNGELRIPAWKRLVFVGILGGGLVGDDFVDMFKIWKFNTSLGGGVRFKIFKDRNIAARADLVFWQKTWGFYFVFNEAF